SDGMLPHDLRVTLERLRVDDWQEIVVTGDGEFEFTAVPAEAALLSLHTEGANASSKAISWRLRISSQTTNIARCFVARWTTIWKSSCCWSRESRNPTHPLDSVRKLSCPGQRSFALACGKRIPCGVYRRNCFRHWGAAGATADPCDGSSSNALLIARQS